MTSILKPRNIVKLYNKIHLSIVSNQKQPPRSVPKKRCSENMQQILQENIHAEV